jgi:hypothetical protein
MVLAEVAAMAHAIRSVKPMPIAIRHQILQMFYFAVQWADHIERLVR